MTQNSITNAKTKINDGSVLARRFEYQHALAMRKEKMQKC